MYNPEGFKKKTSHLLWDWQLGVGVVSAAGGLGLLGAEFFRLQQVQRTFADYLYLALLTINLALIPSWIWVIRRELEALTEWLDPGAYRPPSDIRQMLDAVFVAGLLVVLIIAARDPFWYGVMHCITTVSALFLVVRQVNPEVAEAVLRSRTHLAKEGAVADARLRLVYGRGLDVLEEYFLKRPHIWRYSAGLIGGLVGLGFAAVWKLTGDGTWRIAAYLMFIALLTTLEAVIVRWRLARDQALWRLSIERQEIEDCIAAAASAARSAT